jgi:NADPH:quinone reductase-like Zn-dependent oxidoreductase
MPKAVRCHKLGGPENLILEELASKQPGEGEARLRVEAVGLNRAEALFMRGQYFEQPVLPSRIGYEAAGIVEAVGPGVDASWIGKKVATTPGYSMSEFGVLGEEAIVPVTAMAEYPARLSSVEGAAIWMQYLTAYGALVVFGHATSRDFVVITAASSSVGLAAIQIAKAEGATAIATTRTSKKREELISLGADYVIATAEEDLPQRVNELTGGKGARLIFDPVAGPFLEQLALAAAPRGIIFEYGGLSMQPTPFPLLSAVSKGVSVRGYSMLEIRRDPHLLKGATKYVYDRLDDSRFHPKIAKTFPLAQASEAYQYLESNEQVGKVVVVV